MFPVHLRFCDELRSFLRPRLRAEECVTRHLHEKSGIKDVIEACGVPHTEVDLLLLRSGSDGLRSCSLEWQLEHEAMLQVYAAPAPREIFPDLPRLQRQQQNRFVADGHLGKLVRNLRLLGIDVAYERDADDRRLLEVMETESRALLTRDRPLLRHSVVRDGYCPRSDQPEAQTTEVLRRFALSSFQPLSRCLACNAPLEVVPKSAVSGRLAGEPLTLRHFEDFRRCLGCEKVYWPGSHHEKLTQRLQRLLAAAAQAEAMP